MTLNTAKHHVTELATKFFSYIYLWHYFACCLVLVVFLTPALRNLAFTPWVKLMKLGHLRTWHIFISISFIAVPDTKCRLTFTIETTSQRLILRTRNLNPLAPLNLNQSSRVNTLPNGITAVQKILQSWLWLNIHCNRRITLCCFILRI